MVRRDVDLPERSGESRQRFSGGWVEGWAADLQRPWESWACFLSDVQDSWVGTLAESAPGGCAAGKSAKPFQGRTGYDITQKPVSEVAHMQTFKLHRSKSTP